MNKCSRASFASIPLAFAVLAFAYAAYDYFFWAKVQWWLLGAGALLLLSLRLPNELIAQVVQRIRRRRFFCCVAVVGATLLTYYSCEAVFRIKKYRDLFTSNLVFDVVVETPYERFDEDQGFKYIPNTKTRYIKFPGNASLRLPHKKVIRFNNAGNVSANDVNLQKPNGEYRIALLGDSFTACLEMNEPWPDQLEKRLNQDDELKQHLSALSFNVLNFGRDGIGIVQCALVCEHEVAKYDPDLVILNFITDDILRRVQYRNTVYREMDGFDYSVTVHSYSQPCSFENAGSFLGTVSLDFEAFEDPVNHEALQRDIRRLMCQRVNWISLYPELLASRVGFLPERLFSSYGLSRYFDVGHGLVDCAVACEKVQNRSAESMFLYMPTVLSEIRGTPTTLVKELMAQSPSFEVTQMSAYLPQAGTDEIESWFIPNDGHMNDRGGKVYAGAVHDRLRDYFLLIEDSGKEETSEKQGSE